MQSGPTDQRANYRLVFDALTRITTSEGLIVLWSRASLHRSLSDQTMIIMLLVLQGSLQHSLVCCLVLGELGCKARQGVQMRHPMMGVWQIALFARNEGAFFPLDFTGDLAHISRGQYRISKSHKPLIQLEDTIERVL